MKIKGISTERLKCARDGNSTRRFPMDWRVAFTLPLHKRNVDLQDCGENRRISLLLLLTKTYAKGFIGRMVESTKRGKSEKQSGFRNERRCSDQIVVVRKLYKKM